MNFTWVSVVLSLHPALYVIQTALENSFKVDAHVAIIYM